MYNRRRYRARRETPPLPAPFPWRADDSEGASCPVDVRTCEKSLEASGAYDPRAGTAYEYAYRIGDAVYIRIAMTVGGWIWYPAAPKEK